MSETTPLLVTHQPGRKKSVSFNRRRETIDYPEMMPNNAYQRRVPRLTKESLSEWVDDSDSDAEYMKDPSKRPEESTIQSYMVVAIVVAVLAILAAIKGYHIFHGTEEREENRPKGGYY